MRTSDKIIMPHLGILVTTFCNLNCRRCADLIPKRENLHYDIDEIIEHLNKILTSVDYIKEVLIIGGETFLYPKLISIIKKCADEPKIGKIIITTNGTIIPNEEVLKVVKEENVIVRVSGYPESVAPNRDKLIEILNKGQYKVENLEGMTWLDMGDNSCRNRSEEELTKVFNTCDMKSCVTLTKGGKIFYCSRQISADENCSIYPKPLANEYVDINDCDSSEQLSQAISNFYNLKYITTCNFCDGISCVTKRIVPTAIQMLNKGEYFELISFYESINTCNNHNEFINLIVNLSKTLISLNEKLLDVDLYMPLLEVLSNILNQCQNVKFNIQHKNEVINYLYLFLKSVTKDYNFKINSNNDFMNKIRKNDNQGNFSNVITIGTNCENECDLLLTENEIIDAAQKHWIMDTFDYNRLYVLAKLNRLKNEKSECVISGLSYTQYGIIEKLFTNNVVNISVTGQDIPYSVLMAKKALEYNNNIKVIVIPFAYFHESYDMSSDSAEIHKSVVSRVNIPILGAKQNYKDQMLPLRIESPVNPIFIEAFDLEKLRVQIEETFIEQIRNHDFFDNIPRSKTGGLKFDFKELNYEEKMESAKITAQLNERICTDMGRLEVEKMLIPFLNEMEQKEINVLFFTPPMTQYLQEAYSKELKQRYYALMDSIVSKYNNISFEDYSNNELFNDNDFCDFEHLSEGGAVKLSKLLSKEIEKIISG